MHDELKNSILKDANAATENDARLNLLYEIGRILASLETMNEAAPQILEAICRNLRFEIGELWCLGKGETTLKLESVWHLPSPLLEKFVAESRPFEFAVGVGLPGKVWAKNAPVWIENLSGEEQMPRRFFAEEVGLQSGFAFPILLGERFIGAFNFFSIEPRRANDALLQMFAAVGNHIGQFIKREKTESSLRESEDRYRAFIEQSTEGIWRFELDEKFSVNLSVDEQVELAFERGYLAECNDAMARMYGLERAEDLVGSRIADFLDMTDAANVEYIRSFIESGYNLVDAESHEKDVGGNDKYFLNSLIGTIENGCLIRVWGTQRDITEQKKTAKSLVDNEERYRALVEATSTVVWRANENGELSFVGASWENVSGQRVEEILGSGWLDALHPDDREKTIQVWQHALATKNIYETEFRVLTTGGEYRWFAVRGVPVLNANGTVREWIGANTDITNRKLAEEAVRESEESYRIVAETASDAVIKIDEDSRILFVNSAVERIFGYTVEEMVGESLTMIMPENLRERHRAGIRRYMETGERHLPWESMEIPALHADGHTFPLEISFGEYNQNGRRFFTGIARDITDRKRAENDLRESETNLRLATGAARMYSWELDLKTQIARFGENFSQVTGFDKTIGEMNSGEFFQELLHPEDLEKSARYLEHSAAETGSHSVETRLVNPENGAFIWLETTSYTVRDENGEPQRIVGVSQNITERKRAEETLLERERLAFLNSEISEALIENNSLPDILHACTEIIVKHLDAAFARIWTFDKADDALHLQASSGIYTHLDGEHSRVPLGKYKIGLIAAERKPHLTNAVIGDARVNDQEWARRENMVAFAGYPLIVEDRLVGVVAMFARQTLSEQTLRALASVANIVALGIERKQSEEALRESEANFRQLAEAVPQFVWVTEANGSLSYVNRQWLDFSGLTLEQINDSQATAEIFHPDDAERLAKEWEKSFSTGEVLEVELRMRNPRGEYRWFLTRSRPIKNANGDILKWFGTSTDITDGKQAENRLFVLAEISELTRTFENPDELLFAVSKVLGEHLEVRRCLFNEIDLEQDRETVHRDYCRGVESVAGVHRISDYSSLTSAEITAGNTIVNNDSKIDSRTAADYSKTYEPNGERAYVAVPLLRENRWVASLWVSDDKPREWSRQEVSLLETVAERTWTAIEKLRINVALRESQEVLSLAMSSSRMGAWSRDLATEEVYWSAELEEIFGLQAGTFAGNINGFYDYVYAEDKERLAREAGNALSERRDYIVEFRFHHADGSLRWMEGRGQGIYAFDGQPIKVYGIGIDITERKQSETERERLLESEQQAREIAEQANYAKDEFIALVSHELRSPLNAMLGWTRILQEQKPDGKTVEYALDVIVRNARSQSRLIEDLLDIARVGKGKLRLELEPIELEPIISAAIEIIKPTAESKRIKINQTLDRAANFITGDVDRLRQVVENLLANAVKFTPEGGSVNVRLSRENDEAKIVISDTGQGISAEFLPQIFERFKQADPSTTRRHGGLGIGLSLARDLVELHGGTISAQSEGEGTGATFTVSLPVRMVLPIAEGLTGSKVENMDTEGKLSGFWILAVDDEADAREIVSFMLQINGARVTTANSAVEALEILKSSNERLPDVLLSDISMPNESGYALLEKVRSLPEENGGQIPAVALTAFNRPEDRQSAFEAGFQKHLGKPVEMDDLIAAIIETAGAR